jgi:hypothetical protein
MAADKLAGHDLHRELPMRIKLPRNDPPSSLAMSTSNFGAARELTQDEQILHHHAAMVKKDLEAYRACSRSEEDWEDLFTNRLARLFLSTQELTILTFIQAKSMDFYFHAGAHGKSSDPAIRVHPLLLSLSEAIKASETNPDISSISENDERVLRSNIYTLPSALPPLEIHFSGQNGSPLLSN